MRPGVWPEGVSEDRFISDSRVSPEPEQHLTCTLPTLKVLSYLDFFPTGVQRVAVVTAANICRGISAANADAAQAAVPMLTALLEYSVSCSGMAPPARSVLGWMQEFGRLKHLRPPDHPPPSPLGINPAGCQDCR